MATTTVTPARPRRPAERPAEAWHALAPAEVVARLGGEPTGLSAAEAVVRLDLHGPNRLPRAARRSALARLAAQVHNLLIYVLLVSAAISASIGHPTDALVIFGVVVANAVIGFVQEGRAERSLDAIRAMVDPTASVLRDGHRVTLPADGVVPGDVVLLEAGDRVPADLRLTSAHALRVDEATLTGESVPVDKDVAAVAADAALGDRTDMAFAGTFVTAGQGAGVVVATAGETELGRVGAMIGAVERLTSPLVREMDRFARQVTVVVLVASVAVFAYAVGVAGHPVGDAFMAVVGIAVAAIPEGLPAVLTITLAVGVRRMARRNAIVRRLPAVETLGAVSIICSDKTGTLTRNEMTVRALVTGGREITVEGAGYAPSGGFLEGGVAVDPAADRPLEELALAGLLCNDADIRETGGAWIVDGDPMEGALVTLAAKAGHDARAARERFARIGAIPFDSRHRTMAVLVDRGTDGPVAYLKGAPEAILAASALEATADGAVPIDVGHWERAVERLAAEGLRVLALARRRLPAGTD
ncbi:cation-translocating P-type ATPase, partial [Oharaeibacter diazotrophicus]